MDFGLMTEVDENKRFALLEYISHLLAKDYAATLDDLVTLEFIPADVTADPAKKKIVAPILASILEQLSAGGGANAVNIEQVGRQVDVLSEEYPIVIPSYFGLVLRAFGALEGLGLSVDDRYSIVKECFPYLSRRLLSDDSPRIRTALRTFLYGVKGRLDVKRVDELANGYRTFTKIAAEAASGEAFVELRSSQAAQLRSSGEETDPTLAAAVKILFSEQGNYVQELIIEEAVNIADALSRSVSKTALRRARSLPNMIFNIPEKQEYPEAPPDGRFGGASLVEGQRLGTRLGRVNPLYPIYATVRILEEIVRLTDEDLDSLKTLKRLLQILAGVEYSTDNDGHVSSGVLDADDVALVRQAISKLLPRTTGVQQGVSGRELRSQVQEVSKLLRDVAPGARSIIRKFGKQFVSRSLTRIADFIEREA